MNIDIREKLSPTSRKDSRAGFQYDQPSEFTVTYTPVKSGIFSIYLYGAIEDPTQFISAIEVMQAASENDTIIIHLSTPGGSLDATDTFLAAMHECDAHIIVKATGGVHSAGSVILMHANEFTLSENFNCLIHNGYCGGYDKFSDWKARSKHSEQYMETVMRRTYEGFLTPDEIEAMLNGKDFWLNADQFIERWEARNKLLMAKAGKTQDDLMATLKEQFGLSEDPKPTKSRKKRVTPAPEAE